jgi:predicted phage-related endonuclease
LDGISADGSRVVEIKCGRAAHQRATARNRPPPHHYAQLQHILSVTGLPTISYWCYFPGCRPVHLEIVRDEAYIARLLEAEEVFWKRITGRLR